MQAVVDTSSAAAPSMQGKSSLNETARLVDRHVQALGEAVGASVRRVFQHQALHAQSSIADIHQHLPELSQFVDSVRAPLRSPTVRGHLRLMIKVFGASSATWLSHSARQSGVTALLCRQLVQMAVDADAQGDKAATAVVSFVARVLLDALLMSCSSRLGVHCRACEWRQRKPKYHAMVCALVWHTLLPFVESLALQWPEQIADVLDAHCSSPRPQRMRVNCVFAQVSGIWTLIERLHASITEGASTSTVSADVSRSVDAPKVVGLMQRLIQFLIRTKLLGAHQVSDTEAEQRNAGAPDFDDLLMEKFFVELQGFMFSCSRSREVVGPALQSVLADALVRATSDGDQFNGVFVAKLSVLAGLSCISIKGQAEHIISTLLHECRARDETTEGCMRQRRQLLRLAVGFAAHFDLVGLSSVLDLLSYLLDCYRESEDDRVPRAESAVFIVYVAFHRREALNTLKNGTGSTTWQNQVRDKLLGCQDRVCGQVDPLAFRTLPTHWMAVFWKDWISLSDEDVTSFQEYCSSSIAADDGTSGDTSDAMSYIWTVSADSLPFRSWSATLAISSAHVRPHWIPPHDLESSRELLKSSAKRKAMRNSKDGRLAKRVELALDPEQEERKLSVLLLPEVMERICSFISAKRLRRLASVCKSFAEISRRDSLWRPLWLKLASKEPEPPVCNHGALFKHDWMGMYWARTEARRRVCQKQKRLASSGSSGAGAISDGNDEDGAADGEPILQICSICDCHVVLTSTAHATKHMAAHKLYSCEKAGCGASFSSAIKLKLHRREAHPVRKRPTKALPLSSSLAPDNSEASKKTEKKEKTRVACGFDGCAKTYVSLKRLASHRKQHDHFPEA